MTKGKASVSTTRGLSDVKVRNLARQLRRRPEYTLIVDPVVLLGAHISELPRVCQERALVETRARFNPAVEHLPPLEVAPPHVHRTRRLVREADSHRSIGV